MTPTEIISKLNEIRVTVKHDEAMVLETLNNLIGCDNALEKLMVEVKKIDAIVVAEDKKDA